MPKNVADRQIEGYEAAKSSLSFRLVRNLSPLCSFFSDENCFSEGFPTSGNDKTRIGINHEAASKTHSD